MTNAPYKEECPRAGIAAYLDGEMASSDELALEFHLASCKICTAELNSQKHLLNALDAALDHRVEIELPADFTKVVVANAESNVRGFRCPRERGRALTVVMMLLVLVIVGLGAETSRTFAAIGEIAEQIVAVAAFFGRFVHDATVATALLIRSVSANLVFHSAVSAVVLALFFGLSLLVFSRLVVRHGRS